MSVMANLKSVIATILGIVFIGSLIGYSGEEVIPDVPKPDAGLCGVTKDSFDNVPGAGAIIDINVVATWDDSNVWIGIISVDEYESLDKLPGNSEGEIVSCDASIEYIAGGPSSGTDSKFDWIPDGEKFHIIIGSLEEPEEDDDDEEESPWPFSDKTETKSFVDEFTVTVDYTVSAGWGSLILMLIAEMVLGYLILLDRASQDSEN